MKKTVNEHHSAEQLHDDSTKKEYLSCGGDILFSPDYEAAKFVAGPVHLRLGKMFLNGLGTEKNYRNALICYQKAEAFLYDMVAAGDPKYKKSLQAAISGQAKVRELLLDELPEDEWDHD